MLNPLTKKEYVGWAMADELDEGFAHQVSKVAFRRDQVHKTEQREQEPDHHGDEQLPHNVAPPESRAALVPQRG